METTLSSTGTAYCGTLSSLTYERATIAKVRIILNLVQNKVIKTSLQLKKTLDIYDIGIDEKIVKDVFDKLSNEHISTNDAIVLLGYELNEDVPKTNIYPIIQPYQPQGSPWTTQPFYHVGDVFPAPFQVTCDGNMSITNGNLTVNGSNGYRSTTDNVEVNGTVEALPGTIEGWNVNQ